MQSHFFSLKKVFSIYFLLICFFHISAQTPVTEKGTIVTSNTTSGNIPGDVYAIITGVSNYPGISPLKYADKDAILFRDFLQTPNGGNVKPENIFSLINDSAKAANFNVKAYSWLQRKKLKKGDRLYIYFSGHGDAMDESLYFFLPYDCTPNKDDHNYLGTGNINMHTVKNLFIKPQTAKGVEVLLVMDACRTNELPGGKEGQQNFTKNFIAEEKMGEIMLLSTGAGQVSFESADIGNGHGLFTYYLIDGLAGAADKNPENGDNDGKVSLFEIGAYVKSNVNRIARTKYGKTQIPYYCCEERNMAIISTIDTATYTAWENTKKLLSLSAGNNSLAINSSRPGQRAVNGLEYSDTSQIKIYNQFLDALKKEKLEGNSSAELYFIILEKKWPGSNITEDARFSLAAKYLNFCQQKINLFLNGKGLIHIIYMEKDLKKERPEKDKAALTETDEQISNLKTLISTGFDEAASMMEKVIIYLKDEPALLEPVLPKLDFLRTMATYSKKGPGMKDIRQQCRQAIASDPVSPAGYLLMGWILQDLQDDSCEYYFKKSASIAPKWAYPVNSLGEFYVSRSNKKEAIQYFLKAIQLDSLFVNAYRDLGMTYYNQRIFDSAKLYLKKSIDLNPCDSYSNENYGSVNAEYISQEFGSTRLDSIYFAIARKFYMKSIACDSNFATGYQKMAELYSRAKYEDSAFSILQKCVTINPENAEGFRNLGTYYLKTLKDTTTASAHFSKAISLYPSAGDNYFSLARLYRKQKNKNKAIEVYMDALDNIGNNKDLFNEMGNTYFEAPSDFDKAIMYYKKALETDSTLAYVYFNLGKLYGVKDTEKGISVSYYSKAVFFDPVRFQKTNHLIANYYYENKDFENAKKYYKESLTVITATRYRDVEQLINILIIEKNPQEAENTVKRYLHPENDKQLYNKLTDQIEKAKSAQ